MSDAASIEEGVEAALGLLRRAATPHGFVASPDVHANYRRVWARDGIVSGLAGLAHGDDALAGALRATLDTLAAAQAPWGGIPSNVAFGPNGAVEAVSYGGLAGRVDAVPWFVLGVAEVARRTGDAAFAERHAPAVEAGLRLMEAWEFNGRGLVYVPQSGDWADEYDLHGYLLYDQALRLAALAAWAPFAERPSGLERLVPLVRATFWPEPDADPGDVYHAHAHGRFLGAHGPPRHPLAALTPGGYAARFDGFGTAVALGFGNAIFRDDQTAAALDFGERLRAESASGLLPAFWPPVREGDPAWPALAENYRDTFSNRPGHYHNGGAWPVVTGFWAAALGRHGRREAATDALGRLVAFGRKSAGGKPAGGKPAAGKPAAGEPWGFHEYAPFDADEPRGVRHLTWSAAAVVLAHVALREPVPRSAVPRLVPHTKEFDAVVAGEVLVDLLSSEPADDLGEAGTFERYAGGSAANLAANLARVGRRVAFVGAVGRDGFGRFLRRELEPTGLTLRLAERAEAPTTQVTVARTTGTPDFAAYRGADRLLRTADLPDALLASARLFHTSGFALTAEPARTVLLDAARRARALGATVSLDVNFFPASDAQRTRDQAVARTLCALGAFVKCSADDLARLFGADTEPEAAVARLHADGAELVCFTRGAEGARISWARGAERVDVPALPVTVRDATGAGDAFWAGFLAAWLGGSDPAASAASGARLAALKVQHVGPLPARVDPAVLGL